MVYDIGAIGCGFSFKDDNICGNISCAGKVQRMIILFYIYMSLLLLCPQIVTMQFRVLVAMPIDESFKQGLNLN